VENEVTENKMEDPDIVRIINIYRKRIPLLIGGDPICQLADEVFYALLNKSESETLLAWIDLMVKILDACKQDLLGEMAKHIPIPKMDFTVSLDEDMSEKELLYEIKELLDNYSDAQEINGITVPSKAMILLGRVQEILNG
jgi:hypothetical protein